MIEDHSSSSPTKVTARIQYTHNMSNTTLSNSTIIKGAWKVLLIILLIIANCFGFWYMFQWMSIASSLFNILGLVGIFVLLVGDILILKAILKTHTKK